MLNLTKVSITFICLSSFFCTGLGRSSPQRTYFNELSLHGYSYLSENLSRDDDADKLAIVLPRLINESYSGFRDLRAGTGKSSDGTVTYPCSLSVPGASSTVIRISDDLQPYVSAEFYSGTNRDKAEKTYGDIVVKVKSILSNWHGDERKTVRDGSTSWNYSSRLDDNSARVSVSFTSYVRSGDCSVHLTIWAPEALTPTAPQNNVGTTPWQGGALERLAGEVVQKLAAGDYEGSRTKFNSQMKRDLSAQMLEQGWKKFLQQFGNFRSQDPPQTRQARGYNIVTITCRMDQGAIEVEVDFDTTGNIGGLWIRPANPLQ